MYGIRVYLSYLTSVIKSGIDVTPLKENKMSQYKMVCLDIDGTLLNSAHKITKNTKESIQKVVNEKQIPVVLVSARMPKGILFLQEELNIVQPIICYSGALICDNNRILSNITMSLSQVKQVHKFAVELGIHLSIYREDEWYIEQMDKWAEQEGKITQITPSITNLANLLDEWENKGFGPNKILCMAKPEDIKILHSRIMDSHLNKFIVYPSKSTYLEMSSIRATKTFAIDILAQKYGISQSEILAIGDNYNDINMIEYAGLGIAMGNAPDDVKSCANEITLSNDEDGVVEALRKHILLK